MRNKKKRLEKEFEKGKTNSTDLRQRKLMSRLLLLVVCPLAGRGVTPLCWEEFERRRLMSLKRRGIAIDFVC